MSYSLGVEGREKKERRRGKGDSVHWATEAILLGGWEECRGGKKSGEKRRKKRRFRRSRTFLPGGEREGLEGF